MAEGAVVLVEEKTRAWDGVFQLGGDLMDRLAGSVKEVTRTSLLRQAIDARERGNTAAAFWLLEEEHSHRPDDPDVCSAFWDVAVEYANQKAAVSAVQTLICRHAGAGELELARQYWCELADFDRDALAPPAALSRILPSLLGRVEDPHEDEIEYARDRNALLCGLRAIVSEHNEGLTAGVAYRAVEIAKSFDPETALRAARFCIEAPDLHEVKRERLVEWVRDLESEAKDDCPVPLPRQSGSRIRVKTMQGDITRLDRQEVALAVPDGREVTIDFASIEAVAVAEVEREPGEVVFVTDLLLAHERESGALRTVRTIAPALDAMVELMDAPPIRMRDLVAIILNRSGAVALPDYDSLLGDRIERFDCFKSYQARLTQWERASQP